MTDLGYCLYLSGAANWRCSGLLRCLWFRDVRAGAVGRRNLNRGSTEGLESRRLRGIGRCCRVRV